jgi:UPF0176 protein
MYYAAMDMNNDYVMSNPEKIVVITFYKFVSLHNYREMRAPLLAFCQENRLRGTILLAEEGINATVSGDRPALARLLDYLYEDKRLAGMEYKESGAPVFPFHRMKVKLKKEIVTMAVPGIEPDKLSGIRVNPAEWNALISDPDVVVIDTRNQYECDVGMFKNATSPQIASFSEFPDYVTKTLDPAHHKKVAMYCTGGIRCEKASAYMLTQGFEQVYQLNGGILKYLEDIQPEQNLWNGECFVFDGRVAVNKALQPGEHELCYSCRHPLSPDDRLSDKYEEGISCPLCFDTLTDTRRASLKERQRQVTLAKQRNQQHIGAPFITRPA